MLCPKCNTQNLKEAKFCAKCGYKLEQKGGVMTENPKDNSLGLPQNTAGLLCYLGGPVTGIVFLLLEKKNKFIRFHAMQSTIVFGALLVLRYSLGWFLFTAWGFRSFLYTIINMVTVILWIVLMVKAYQGEKYKLPAIGEIAEKQV